MMQAADETRVILVVDDDPRNTRLLTRILEVEGYETRTAPNGESALELLQTWQPDMLLIDVMMPGMDGFELCRRIKSDERLRLLPTLLVTALTDMSDKVRGLDSGADDFLTKPINRAELLARVRTHFRIKLLRDEVVESRESLAKKNRKLAALERMREDLMQMLVHDLKNPLGAIQLNVELLQQTLELSDQGRPTLANIADCASRLSMMVQNILEVARLDEAEVKLELDRFEFHQVFEDVARSFQVLLDMEDKSLMVNAEPMVGKQFVGDSSIISRIVQNLVANAVKVSPERGEVLISAEPCDDDAVLVTVADRGPGVPDELTESIFEKFSGVEARRNGLMVNHGLGLTFCKLAVEAHGGTIWVEAREGGGSLFRVKLPSRALPASRLPERDAVELVS